MAPKPATLSKLDVQAHTAIILARTPWEHSESAYELVAYLLREDLIEVKE